MDQTTARIDAHHHFWQYDAREYGWIGPEMHVLQRDYLPADLAPLLAAAGFHGSVAVQARQTVAESHRLLALADAHDFIRGVVGWADLCSPAVHAQLEALAPHPRFVGVRHVLHDEADDDFALRADFRRGIAALAGYGLTYDLLLFPRHLPVAYRLAREFPQQPFVVDHMAKPPIRAGLLEPWRQEITRLAALPNVWCKVSGLVTEADHARWQPADLAPYLDVALEAFGPDRLMLGSDWPVCRLAGEYSAVMQVGIEYIERLSPTEQAAMAGGAAIAFYGLAGAP